jgi:hypothetical protein
MSRRSTRSLANAPLHHPSRAVVEVSLRSQDCRGHGAASPSSGGAWHSSWGWRTVALLRSRATTFNKTGALSEHDRCTSRSMDRERRARRPQATLAKGDVAFWQEAAVCRGATAGAGSDTLSSPRFIPEFLSTRNAKDMRFHLGSSSIPYAYMIAVVGAWSTVMTCVNLR